MNQSDRSQLRKYGVRFGAFNLYFPTLLKPAAAELLLQLWALHGGQDHGIDINAMPERPQQGLTSVPADNALPEPYWRAAGFHLAGGRAVRIDMLERLSDLIRARVTWRAEPKVKTPKSQASKSNTPKAAAPGPSASPADEQTTKAEDGSTTKTDETEPAAEAHPDQTSAARPAEVETPTALEAQPAAAPETPQPPSGATGDGGFRVVPEMMSIVGCSGDEFASILRGLGFRLERRKIVTTPKQQPLSTSTAAGTSDAGAQDDADGRHMPAEESDPGFDEIWRPVKRRHQQPRHWRNKGRKGSRSNAGHGGDKAERAAHSAPRPNASSAPRRGKKSDRFGGNSHDRGRKATQLPRRERRKPEDSPFAALMEFRETLATSKPGKDNQDKDNLDKG